MLGVFGWCCGFGGRADIYPLVAKDNQSPIFGHSHLPSSGPTRWLLQLAQPR